MARYNGMGWHNQSTRHSNARKYGKAGGDYAKRYVLIGKSQGQTRILGSFKKRIDAETKEGILGFEPTDEKVEYKIKEYTPKRKAGWYDIGHSHYGKTKSEYDFFEDPSHGWLKVPKAELERLGIAGKISGFSYMSKDNAYLEEDSDATMFINAKKSIGEEVKIKQHITDNDSPVRRKQGYYNITPELKTQIEQMRNDMLKTKEWDAKTTRKINNASERQLRFWKERGLY